MARRTRTRPRKATRKPGPAKPSGRNPMARHLRRRGHAVLPSLRPYRRRPKHKKPPEGEGGDGA